MDFRLHCYLSLGFVFEGRPEAEATIADLALAAGRNAPQSRSASAFAALLVEILDDLIAPFGDSVIALPLTGGLDSRMLLGACLRIVPPSRLLALTFGRPGTTDYDMARRLTKRLGVPHVLIDTARTDWAPETVDATAAALAARSTFRPRIDGVHLLGALYANAPDGAPILSGFLGDMLSGAHAKPHHADRDPDRAIADFVALNDAHPPAPGSEGPEEVNRRLKAFLETAAQAGEGRGGFSDFDLLDLGLRQRCRIRPGVTCEDARVLTPFADPRMVAFWANAPLADRVGQRLYRDAARSEFPKVFEDRRLRTRLHDGGRRLLHRLRRRLGAAHLEQFVDRGDPRRNRSLDAFIAHRLAGFEARGLIRGHDYGADYAALKARPSGPRWRRVMAAISAETYLGVGARI
jgi:hypothetical protein